MEEILLKYVAACEDARYQSNDNILRVFRESQKINMRYGDGGDTWIILDFAGSSLSVGDCNLLAKCLATDRYIEDLRFTDCLLCEEACRVILSALTFNKVVKRLDLKGNNLRCTGAELVGKLLKRTSSLTELILEWNSLGMLDNGMVAISEGLALNRTLKLLNLSNNQISHEGGTELASSIKRNKTLKFLDLRWNNIGVIGGRAFLSALQVNKSIVKLQLGGKQLYFKW